MGNPYAPPPGDGARRPEQPPVAGGRGPEAAPPPSGPHAGDAPPPGAPLGWPSPGTPPGTPPPWGGPPPPGTGAPPGPGRDRPHGPHGQHGQQGQQGQHGQHGGPAHGQRAPRPQQPAPDSPIVRATGRRVMHFLVLLLAAVVTSALPVPWQAAALLFMVAAIGVGLRALVLAWRGGIRGGLVVMLTVGVAMAGFVGLGMLSLLALWPQQLDRQECLARAVTIAATRDCEVAFERSIDERFGGLRTGGA